MHGEWPRTDRDRWGARGTTGGAHGSFARRYRRPLELVGRRRFGLGAARAQELASAFLAHQVEREGRGTRAVFDVWDPERGRLRDYLFVSFRNFCRQEFARERREAAAPLDDALEVEVAAGSAELSRLVAREQLNHVRDLLSERIAKQVHDPRARERLGRYLDLRWPADLEGEVMSEAEIAARLGISRSERATLRRAVLEQILFVIAGQLHREGLSDEAARLTTEGCYRYLAGEG